VTDWPDAGRRARTAAGSLTETRLADVEGLRGGKRRRLFGNEAAFAAPRRIWGIPAAFQGFPLPGSHRRGEAAREKSWRSRAGEVVAERAGEVVAKPRGRKSGEPWRERLKHRNRQRHRPLDPHLKPKRCRAPGGERLSPPAARARPSAGSGCRPMFPPDVGQTNGSEERSMRAGAKHQLRKMKLSFAW